MIKETQQQKDAKTIGLNISLSANAGTGKTTVLVDRYMSLLESGVNINEIAAITFTKKAASEMVERLANKIDAKISALSQTEPNNSNKLLHYRRTRRKLSSANISTIHSFCITILKDYALELGLEPNFKQLSDVEKFNIEQDSIASVLENILQNMDTISDDNYYKDILFSNISRDKIERYIACLLKRLDIFNDITTLYDNGYAKYEELILQNYYDLTVNFINDFTNNLSASYNTISKLKYNSEADRTEILQMIDDVLDTYKKTVTENCAVLDSKKYLLLVEKIIKLSKIKIGIYYVVNKIQKKYHTDIIKMLGDSISLQNLELYFYLSKEIVNITTLVYNRIDEEKHYSNGIDFDDILILTRKLLVDNPLIANTISSEYKEIMVDEFQDTNVIQYDIIKALVPKLNNYENTFSPNIFIVGDPKQSIYRFRNADVTIFNKAIVGIKTANSKNNKALKLNNGNLELTATFRTLPIITGFINKVCSNLFGKVVANSNIHYSDLVCGRNWEIYTNLAKNVELTDEFGSIHFLLFREIKNKNNESIVANEEGETDNNEENSHVTTSDSIKEGKLIANEIKLLMNNTKYNYSDIAILYRSRTSVDKLKKALDENDIPYIEQGGTGFYEQPEIIHLVNYLKFLNNQQNDLALVGILLSPFFALSNTDLFNIKSMGEITMWENLQKYNKKYQYEHINYVCVTLQNHIKLAPNLSIAHIINTILKNGLWMSRLSLLKSEQAQLQVLDNISTFIAKAREFQSKGFVSLNDFVEEIDLLGQINVKDTDTTKTTISAINLLTIHAAKGLEFPIIFLYNLNSVGNNNVFPVVNKTFGLGFPMPDFNNYGSTEETLAGLIIKNEESNLNYFEELRLLYVAMTRAKDSLYFSANCSKNNKNSMLSLIVKGLGYDDINTFIDKNKNSQPIDTQLNIKILNCSNESVNANVQFHFKYYENDLGDSDFINNENLQKKLPTQEHIQFCTEKFYETNKVFSFSGLNEIDKILDGNTNFLKENIIKKLGFDNFSDFNISMAENDNNYAKNDYIAETKLNYAAQKGILYHNLLANINCWYKNNVINERFLLNLIEKELQKNPEVAINNLKILENIQNIVTTKLIQQYKSNFYSAKFEYSLMLPFEDNFITGIIDCLIQNTTGEWEIWDWKTNYINDDNKKQELEENYKLQLELYLYLLMHLFPTQAWYTARLLFMDLALPQEVDELWTSSLTLTIQEKDKLRDTLKNKIKKSSIKVTVR